MKEQIVVRTFTSIYLNGRNDLENKLKEGYKVVMCNPVGDYLEYILEKEIEDFHAERTERRGKWHVDRDRDDGGINLCCSECRHRLGIKNESVVRKCIINYCSNCGAEMENSEDIAMKSNTNV